MTRSPRNDLPGAVSRMVAALILRAEAGDDAAFDALVSLSVNLSPLRGRAADALHASGYSWAEVGRRLGITRQGAEQLAGRARAKSMADRA